MRSKMVGVVVVLVSLARGAAAQGLFIAHEWQPTPVVVPPLATHVQAGILGANVRVGFEARWDGIAQGSTGDEPGQSQRTMTIEGRDGVGADQIVPFSTGWRVRPTPGQSLGSDSWYSFFAHEYFNAAGGANHFNFLASFADERRFAGDGPGRVHVTHYDGVRIAPRIGRNATIEALTGFTFLPELRDNGTVDVAAALDAHTPTGRVFTFGQIETNPNALHLLRGRIATDELIVRFGGDEYRLPKENGVGCLYNDGVGHLTWRDAP